MKGSLGVVSTALAAAAFFAPSVLAQGVDPLVIKVLNAWLLPLPLDGTDDLPGPAHLFQDQWHRIVSTADCGGADLMTDCSVISFIRGVAYQRTLIFDLPTS